MKIKIELKNVQTNGLIFLILLPILWPANIRYICFPNITKLICEESGIFVSLVFLFVWGRNYLGKLFRNTLMLFIFFLFAWYMVSTAISEYKSFVDYGKIILQIFILCGTFLICTYCKKEKLFLDVIIISKLVTFCLGIVLLLYYPEGIAKAYNTAIDGSYNEVAVVYLWGNKNNLLYQWLPLVGLLAIREEWFGNRISAKMQIITITVISIAISIYIGTASGSMIFFLFLILYLLRNNKTIVKYLNGKIIGIGYLITFFSIVVIQSQGILSIIISKLTGRTINFTGRTVIWESALEYIKASPIIGYGYDAIIPHSGYLWYSHNLILDLLIQGGIVTLLIFGFMYIFAFVNKNQMQKCVSVNILLFAFMVDQIFESMLKSCVFFYLLFFLARQAKYQRYIEKGRNE